MGGIKVQLIWEFCQRPFIGHSSVWHCWTFGQLEEPVSAWSITDVAYKMKSSLSCEIRVNAVWKRASFYLLLLWAHCCRPQCGSLRRGVESWNPRCGPMRLDRAKTESRPSPHLSQRRQGLKSEVTAEMVGFELTGFRSSVCFTPQDCILLHVIRDDLTGKHVTEVKLTSLLYEISGCTLYSYISLCVCVTAC